MALQVYTASLLKEGLVAYLCLDGNNSFWSTDLNKATAVDAAAVDTLKNEADRSERENIIVAPYVIDVDLSDSGLLPLTKREQIRATGPTIPLPQYFAATNGAKKRHAA